MIAMKTANEDAVRVLAHQKWVDEGQPMGRDLDHWQWALAQLQKPVVKTVAAKPIAKAAKKK